MYCLHNLERFEYRA